MGNKESAHSRAVVLIAVAVAALVIGTAPAWSAPCAAGPYPACGGDCANSAEACIPDPGGAAGCVCKPAEPPCSECGPGPHFVHAPGCGPFPPPGSDLIADNGALVGMDTNLDCVRDVTMVLNPCLPPESLLRVDLQQGPIDDSNQYPGTRPIDGHLDVIDTEIISMCLTGGPRLVAGTGGPWTFPLAPSRGAVAEDLINPSLADSFFDVFFEVQNIPGGPAYNITPVRVLAKVNCLPPEADYIHPLDLCLPLFTQGTCVGGPNAGNPCVYNFNCPGAVCGGQIHLANLVEAKHSVNGPVPVKLQSFALE